MTEEQVQRLIDEGKIRVKGMSPSNKKEEKESKYKNKKVTIDGITFASIFEANRYQSLKLLEKAGAIKNLRMQVPYELQPKFKKDGKTYRAITYKADFVYIDVRTGEEIVEDTKGYVTKDYAMKKKMLLFKYPDINFREIRAEKKKKRKKKSPA